MIEHIKDANTELEYEIDICEIKFNITYDYTNNDGEIAVKLKRIEVWGLNVMDHIPSDLLNMLETHVYEEHDR